MDRIAFLFSGQGDQYPGMGRQLYEQQPAARRVFELCESLRPGTLAQCFSGSEQELLETKNTQPCLFALELAAARTLLERGLRPAALAGFSLGELAAATVSGMLTPEAGFRLVCRRGELMQREAERFETSMAAVLRLSHRQVEQLCRELEGLYPVNYNCPGQVTVAGLTARMPELFRAVKQAGGRALPLKLRGAFHSPFMERAAEDFAAELERWPLGRRQIPLYSDLTGELYRGDGRQLLARQICSPVRWEQILRALLAQGIDTFVEIGPGRTLCGMLSKLQPGARALNVMDWLKEAELC